MAPDKQTPSKPASGTQSSSSSASSSSPGGSHSGQGNLSFRCADAGHKECNWQTHGKNEDEILRNVEPHARQHHNITNFDENTRNKVRGAIRREAA